MTENQSSCIKITSNECFIAICLLCQHHSLKLCIWFYHTQCRRGAQNVSKIRYYRLITNHIQCRLQRYWEWGAMDEYTDYPISISCFSFQHILFNSSRYLLTNYFCVLLSSLFLPHKLCFFTLFTSSLAACFINPQNTTSVLDFFPTL